LGGSCPERRDLYVVKGDSTNEVMLRRAGVPTAHSDVILSDEREGKHADGKSVLTYITIQNICRGDKRSNIAAECRNPNNRHCLRDPCIIPSFSTVRNRDNRLDQIGSVRHKTALNDSRRHVMPGFHSRKSAMTRRRWANNRLLPAFHPLHALSDHEPCPLQISQSPLQHLNRQARRKTGRELEPLDRRSVNRGAYRRQITF
jgi:hypothetical protein